MDDVKIEILSVETVLKTGCSIENKRLSVCDLSKQYCNHISDRKYQVHYDSDDKKKSFSEIYQDPYEAAKMFVKIRREKHGIHV